MINQTIVISNFKLNLHPYELETMFPTSIYSASKICSPFWSSSRPRRYYQFDVWFLH